MAKWDFSKLESKASFNDEVILMLESIDRKADIIRMDAARQPERLTIKQRAEEIMAITTMIKEKLK